MLLVSIASAQSVYLGGGAGFSKQLGYKNPGYSVIGGIESSAYAPLFGTAEFKWNSANKIETGDGYSINGTAHAYWHPGSFLLGPGVSATRVFTSQWDKSAAHAEAGAGYWRPDSNFRFMADYIFPWGDPQNAVQGVDARYEIGAHSHLLFRADFQVLRYHVTFRPDLPAWGDAANFSLFWRFW